GNFPLRFPARLVRFFVNRGSAARPLPGATAQNMIRIRQISQSGSASPRPERLLGIDPRSFPIRPSPVVAVDLSAPALVGHVRPIIFVESGRTLQLRFLDIENEAFLVFIDLQDIPRHSE